MPLEGWYQVACAGVEYILQPGDVLLIAPGTLHRIHAPECGRRMIVQADFVPLFHLPEMEIINTMITPALRITPLNAQDHHAKIKACMEAIFLEYFTPGALGGISAYARIIEMLVWVGKAFTEADSLMHKAPSSKNHYDRFILLLDYINQHLTERLTLELLSNMMGFSKFYFSRLFKRITGVPFAKYLSQKRMMLASRHLTDMELSVADVAGLSGFNTLSAFMRMFKLQMNCTPTEYRKQQRER